MSDEQIDYWADIFNLLEAIYGVRSAHHLTFEQFLRGDPAEHERWIHIYFANAALLANRREGANVTLATFLENGAALVMVGALVMDELQRVDAGLQADHDLLPRQQVAAKVFDDMTAYSRQEEDDRHYERTHTVEHRGDRYCEPFHHYHPPAKWKTGGRLEKNSVAL
jgi:hypothetical protein